MTGARIAVVTGAARGIGAAIARRLAADGRAVAAVDLDEAACAATVDAVRAAGVPAIAVGADVSSRPDVDAAIARIEAELGPPTILVNNAGIIRDNLIKKMSDADWDDVMAVHLRGAFLMTRAVQVHMVEQHWGRIVSMSSTNALGARGQANYAAAKAGLQGFTKALSIELGPFGITVNAIAPGFIVTDMTAATATRLRRSVEEHQEAAAAVIPVRRVGQPDDVAVVASFFTSDEASFVSGQVIYVAGGPRA